MLEHFERTTHDSRDAFSRLSMLNSVLCIAPNAQAYLKSEFAGGGGDEGRSGKLRNRGKLVLNRLGKLTPKRRCLRERHPDGKGKGAGRVACRSKHLDLAVVQTADERPDAKIGWYFFGVSHTCREHIKGFA